MKDYVYSSKGHSDGDGERWPWGFMAVLTIVVIVAFSFAFLSGAWGVPRYPVGQPVSSSVYTEPFDPCDPAYKFINPPPKDWAEKFGNSERTMLIHAVSELRVVVAAQGLRILALEKGLKDVDWDLLPRKTITIESLPATTKDPNEVKK